MSLSIFGALILVLPFASTRLKEWAYFGFALNFIGAAVSTWAVDGFGFGVVFPLLFFIPLVTSYWLYPQMGTASTSFSILSNKK